MKKWKMRHQGSPQSTKDLTDAQIIEAVVDGHWEPTDEVIGEFETEWQSLEIHPHFAPALADFVPPTPPAPPDETRLDMNPLIDVSLVLLIFFILTATYEELRKEFPAPSAAKENAKSKSLRE